MNKDSEQCHLMIDGVALKKWPVHLSWEQWLILLPSSSYKLFFPILPSWSYSYMNENLLLSLENGQKKSEIPEIITKLLSQDIVFFCLIRLLVTLMWTYLVAGVTPIPPPQLLCFHSSLLNANKLIHLHHNASQEEN